MIISISGFAGSGKSTIADFLVRNYGFKEEAFASTVKDVLSVVFGWNRNLLEGNTQESRAWRNEVDAWWANKLSIPQFTPRWAMQHIGTNLWRDHFDDKIWIYALEKKLSTITGNVVISDARFQNELAMLSNIGAKLICVERGKKPDWYNWAYKYNLTKDEQAKSYMRTTAFLAEADPNPIVYGIHSSEWDWIGTQFDAIVHNNGSVDDLYEVIELLFNSRALT